MPHESVERLHDVIDEFGDAYAALPEDSLYRDEIENLMEETSRLIDVIEGETEG